MKSYRKYFITKMHNLIINTINSTNLNYCFIKFSTEFYLFKNLYYFYDYSLHNLKYRHNIKKINNILKLHLLYKAVYVLYNNYATEINKLILFKKIKHIINNDEINKIDDINFKNISSVSNSINKYYINKHKINKIIKNYKFYI